jgi:hypothetical protein
MRIACNRLIAAVAVVAAIASSLLGFAQPNADVWGEEHMDARREAALRECNARANSYTQRTWGVRQIQVYRACMAEHHQQE